MGTRCNVSASPLNYEKSGQYSQQKFYYVCSKPKGRKMIAQELEVSLHMAFVEARQKRHEFITVEHLLLALLDNPTAAEVLRACAANIEELRKALGDFIAAHTPTVAGTEEIDTQPTLGFQRVIQRAILHVQSSGKKEVTGANVLDRALEDRKSTRLNSSHLVISYAVFCLKKKK